MEFDQDLEKKQREPNGWIRLLPVGVAAVLIAVILAVMALGPKRGGDVGKPEESGSAATEVSDDSSQVIGDNGEENAANSADGGDSGGQGDFTDDGSAAGETDPQDPAGQELGSQVDLAQLLVSQRVQEQQRTTVGIDVSRYQGTIDWSQVAETGIDFAMIRVGYRSPEADREIYADTNASYNMQEAQAVGIQLGVYFFSTAATEEEAREEALWVAEYISRYRITYPVAFDCEGYEREGSVLYDLSKEQRTDIAVAFMQEIYDQGYTPMFYGSSYAMTDSNHWDMERIEQSYKVWVSQYPALPYPQTERSAYGRTHAMWQYTNQGSLPGISQPVDVNVAYFGYEEAADPVNGQAPDQAYADVEALLRFVEVDETVTAKESTNLRNIPSQGQDSTVLWTLQNGETARRTGVSDSGWSRLEYQEQVCYAVSSLLTTDLAYHPAGVGDTAGLDYPAGVGDMAGLDYPAGPGDTPGQESASEPVSESEDGIKTRFTDCYELMTPKIEINLRALPSVTNPEAVVVATIRYGDVVTRTGINTEVGWSRVEYGGQVLYCVSSYLTPAPAQE